MNVGRLRDNFVRVHAQGKILRHACVCCVYVLVSACVMSVCVVCMSVWGGLCSLVIVTKVNHSKR